MTNLIRILLFGENRESLRSRSAFETTSFTIKIENHIVINKKDLRLIVSVVTTFVSFSCTVRKVELRQETTRYGINNVIRYGLCTAQNNSEVSATMNGAATAL